MMPHPICRREGNGGFSLLEVMIATAILVAGIAAIVMMFSMSKFGNVRGRQLTQAVDIAQSRLDYLTNGVVFEHLSSSTVPRTAFVDLGNNKKDYYKIYTNITTPSVAIGSNLKRIKVEVVWAGGGLSHSAGKHSSTVVLETLRSKN